MRILGYVLLLIGFLWAVYVPLSIGPLVRSMESAYRREYSGTSAQQNYSAKDMISARIYGAEDFSRFVRLGGIGTLIMIAGGVVLDRAARCRPAQDRPPLVPKT